MSAPQRFRKKPVEIEAMQWNGGLTSNHDAPALCATKIIDWVLSNSGTARFVNEGEAHPLRYETEYVADQPYRQVKHDAPSFIVIETLEGPHRANPLDQIIRGVQGEFYPCKPDIFEQTYDRPQLALAAAPVVPVPDAVQTKRALHEAIQAHAGAEWGGDLVVDWVLVAGLPGVEVEHSIGIEESRDKMPAYISNGLLYEALHLAAEYDLADDGD